MQSVFLDAAFSELEVDLTLSHVNALIKISRHEVYSNAVRTLNFAMDQTWIDEWTEGLDEEQDERNYMEQGAGAYLLTKALQRLPNLEVIKIEPIKWVSLNTGIGKYRL